MSRPNSSDEDDNDDLAVTLDDSSDDEMDEGLQCIMEGDFLVVKVDGKKKSFRYIMRIDSVDCYDENGVKQDGAYDGVFLRKHSDGSMADAVFVVDEDDKGRIDQSDIIHKLPVPLVQGGSERRCAILSFKADLEKLDLNY